MKYIRKFNESIKWNKNKKEEKFNYYKDQLDKLNTKKDSITMKFSDGENATKFMNLNKESAKFLSDWLDKNYLNVKENKDTDDTDDIVYLTDKEIEDSYLQWEITDESEITADKDTGMIILERPYDEKCDECDTQLVDYYIIYDSGKIGLDRWYPDFLFMKICEYIYEHLPKDNKNREKIYNQYFKK